MPVWTKICGITRSQDARAAAGLGADAIGLVFHPPSPRAVRAEALPEILADAGGRARRVALFVDPDAAAVERALRTGLIDMLQFHGEEPADFCLRFGLPYIKALRMAPGLDLDAAIERHPDAEMILLDGFDERSPGGTGRLADWERAARAVESGAADIVLAGGLTPENVAAAVAAVAPRGVDASSGLERAPGVKDLGKMRRFVERARRADG